MRKGKQLDSERSQKPKSKARRVFIIIVIVLLIIALALIGLRLLSQGSEEQEDAQEEISYAVRTQIADRGSIHEILEINGEVSSSSSVDVLPDTQGILANIYVELGDYVRAGQVIAEIDPSRPGFQYALNPVKSRVAGTITRLPLDIGSSVSIQTPVAVVGDLSNLELSCAVPERFVSRIYRGMPARIIVPSEPDEFIDVTVSEIDPLLDPLSRSLGVKMLVPRNESRILSGMYLSVQIILQEKADSIRLPVDSIVYRPEETFVYVVNNDDTVAKRDVNTGIVEADLIEILDGINEGDQVVYQGQNLLEPGARVTVLQ